MNDNGKCKYCENDAHMHIDRRNPVTHKRVPCIPICQTCLEDHKFVEDCKDLSIAWYNPPESVVKV